MLGSSGPNMNKMPMQSGLTCQTGASTEDDISLDLQSSLNNGNSIVRPVPAGGVLAALGILPSPHPPEGGQQISNLHNK